VSTGEQRQQLRCVRLYYRSRPDCPLPIARFWAGHPARGAIRVRTPSVITTRDRAVRTGSWVRNSETYRRASVPAMVPSFLSTTTRAVRTTARPGSTAPTAGPPASWTHRSDRRGARAGPTGCRPRPATTGRPPASGISSRWNMPAQHRLPGKGFPRVVAVTNRADSSRTPAVVLDVIDGLVRRQSPRGVVQPSRCASVPWCS